MKKLISFVLVLSLCFALAGCSYGYDKHTVSPAADKLTVSYSDYKKDGYQSFLDKLDAFAAKLTYEIYSDSNKQTNVGISPISVYMALALATECANGETRNEILNAVGVTYDEVKNFTSTLYAFSNREYKYTDMMNNERISGFQELANSIWADRNVKLNDAGVDALSSSYNCDLYSVNFKTDEGEKAINAYIKDKTHGIIDSDIQLSPETLITLINTFYLKEVWNDYGKDLSFTKDTYSFKSSDGSITKTKLLIGYYFKGDIYRGDGFTSFFTKTEHGFEIKFIVPNDDQTLENVFLPQNIYDISNVDDYGYIDKENKLLHHTRVLFPEYEASFDGDIAGILKKDFDINKIFDINECDFSNITDADVALDAVIHKCSVNVNKKGIEGAAITAMPAAGSAGPLEGYTEVYHDYIVDRAFGFVITDSYGTVLFSGAINNID